MGNASLDGNLVNLMNLGNLRILVILLPKFPNFPILPILPIVPIVPIFPTLLKPSKLTHSAPYPQKKRCPQAPIFLLSSESLQAEHLNSWLRLCCWLMSKLLEQLVDVTCRLAVKGEREWLRYPHLAIVTLIVHSYSAHDI